MKLRLGILLAIAVTTIPGVANSEPKTGRTTTKSVQTKRLTTEEAIQGVLNFTNQVRKAHGLGVLKVETRLASAAQWMVQDMASNNYFSHTDSLGRGLGDRVPSFGYDEFLSIRENLAAGHETPEEVVQGWMDSPSHRENLLCPKVTEVGIGYVSDVNARYVRYWAQEFGRPNSIDMQRRVSIANAEATPKK